MYFQTCTFIISTNIDTIFMPSNTINLDLKVIRTTRLSSPATSNLATPPQPSLPPDPSPHERQCQRGSRDTVKGASVAAATEWPDTTQRAGRACKNMTIPMILRLLLYKDLCGMEPTGCASPTGRQDECSSLPLQSNPFHTSLLLHTSLAWKIFVDIVLSTTR